MQTSSPFSTTSRFLTTAPLLFFAVLLALCGTRFVPAQQVEVQVADKVEEEDKAEEEIDVDLDAKEEEIAQEASIEAEFPGGAGLKTDPELETYLKRAEQFVDEGRFDLATILWQRVLDESGETVMTRPSWTYESFERKYRKYQSVSEEIERTIANLPPAGLRQYRRAADGEARAILAGGAGTGGAAAGEAGAVENREPALSDVVRLYFMSSLGDDAAYELACARLDRYDFVGAGRLLSRILNDYPDSDVPRSELLLRLALANARLGDLAAARSALAQLDVAADAGALRRAAAMIQREVDAGAAARADTQAPDAWHLPWGGPQRTGHMQPPPKSITNDTLSEAWFDNFEIDDGFLATAQQMRNQILAHGGFAFQSRARKQQGNAGPPTRDELLARWKSNGWQPTGQMLLHEGFVYYKRHNRVVCRDAETGRLQWMSRRSTYKPPALANWLAQMQRSYGMNLSQAEPSAPMESFVFGDRLNQAMTISDGLLYTVDGPIEGEPAPAPPEQNQRFNYRNIPRRSRTNFLSAYDVINGKFKWYRAADGGVEGSKFQVGYMAAPVPHGKFLLVPVSDNGTLFLHALEKGTGELAWKTFLCEDPMNGASPWSPVGIAVDGGDAYVATGGGVVLAIDAMSGDVRWALRYQRSTKGVMNMARFGRPQQRLQGVDGWEEDVVIPHGRALVVFASDSDKLFALDRRTGELLWETPRQPTGDDDAGLYCVGVLGDGVFVAGRQSVRRYDLNKDGRLMWEARLGAPSFGHGVLTADALFMPTGDAIAKVDAATGKILAHVGVFSPTKEPVGNLFSDGQRFLAVGMARAYALQDLESRLASLARRIEAGESEAQLQRMRLRLRGGNFDTALADLRGAHALRLKNQGPLAANAMLYDGMSEMELVERDPQTAMALIVEAQSHLNDAAGQSNVSEEEMKALIGQRDRLLFAALGTVKQEEIQSAVDEILGVAGIISQPNLMDAARKALSATVTAADAERIRNAIADERESVRAVALAGVGKALGEEAFEPLTGLLGDESDEIRLYAAIALANEGKRTSLGTFGELLESDDLQVRSRTVQALRAMTGQRFKYVAYEKPENRGEAVKMWRQWLAANGQTAELNLPVGDSNALLGRTLVAMYSQNRVVEYDADRKKTWEKSGINRPWGVEGLPNGHRLICSYNGRFVAEFDAEGKEVWRIDQLPGYGSHAHRLENGNTLVTCSNVHRVYEYSPEKKIVWQQRVNGTPQDARRLDNGNTLIALQSANKVVEIDAEGKTVWEMSGLRGAFAARRLDNGNTLVACSGAGQVVEVTPDKKTVWSKSGFSSPHDAQRLDNGNTLIVDSRGYREVDPDGKVLWEEEERGVLRIDRY